LVRVAVNLRFLHPYQISQLAQACTSKAYLDENLPPPRRAR
jgi:hypothetical protein